MTKWDGIERRRPQSDGREGRRPGDQHCHEHHLRWTQYDKDFAEQDRITCGAIARIEADHKEDVQRLDEDIEKKADHKDLRGMMKFVSFLIVVAIAVVAGQALWLRSDIAANTVVMQRLNQRLSEEISRQTAIDFDRTGTLNKISGQISITNLRLDRIEEAQKQQTTKSKGGTQ